MSWAFVVARLLATGLFWASTLVVLGLLAKLTWLVFMLGWGLI